MLFADFVFELFPDGSIRFDEEIKAKDFNVKEGDEFVVAIVNERVVLAKRPK